MVLSPPKLRSDLTVSHQQTAAGTVLVVKDPVSSDFFRFRAVEQFVARQLDGQTPLEAVRQRTEKEFGGSLSPEALSAFIKILNQNGLLESGESTTRNGTADHRRIRGSPLYFRVKVFDPNRLMARLVRRARCFFTPHFLALSATLILLAAGITVLNWSDLGENVSRLYRLSAVPLLVTIVLVVGSAHEFAHGLTCKHFGGEVHEMGFMLIYFQPALYCNVSDAWLFPEKSKRLWVGFAGPYFELFLWALATLAWRLTDMETWINYVALIVMTTSGVKTLFNFNPLIKLDGYYLLSDYLEIPNLRRRSFRYVGDLIKRLFTFELQPAGELSRRERRTYLIYGLVGSAASFSLLGYILVKASSLLETHRPMAFLFFAGFAGLKVRRRLRRLFGGPSGGSDPLDDGDDFSAPTAVSPEPEPKTGNTRSWKPWIVRGALAGALIGVLSYAHMELVVSGPFDLRPEETTDVRSPIEGIIDAIYVDEGDKVKAGDLIARLGGQDWHGGRGQTETEVTRPPSDPGPFRGSPTEAEIAAAKAAVSRAERQLNYAHLHGFEQPVEANVVPRIEREKALQRTLIAEKDLVETQRRLIALLSGAGPESVDATQAQTRLENPRLSITSPATGVIATSSRQLKGMRGELVRKGDLIARVYNLRKIAAEISIPEKEIADIQLGQKVTLRARGYPGKEFHGTVDSIAVSAQEGSGSGTPTSPRTFSREARGATRSVLVTTLIDNEFPLLKPEMTGEAKIYCGRERTLDLVKRRLARTVRIDLWSWW